MIRNQRFTIAMVTTVLLVFMTILLSYIIYFYGMFNWDLWRNIHQRQPDGLIYLMLPYIYTPVFVALGIIVNYLILKIRTPIKYSRYMFYFFIPILLNFDSFFKEFIGARVIVVFLFASLSYVLFDLFTFIRLLMNESTSSASPAREADD